MKIIAHFSQYADKIISLLVGSLEAAYYQRQQVLYISWELLNSTPAPPAGFYFLHHWSPPGPLLFFCLFFFSCQIGHA